MFYEKKIFKRCIGVDRDNVCNIYCLHISPRENSCSFQCKRNPFYYFKFLKPKQDIKGTTDLDEFDFEDYEDDFIEDDNEDGEETLEEAEPDETL